LRETVPLAVRDRVAVANVLAGMRMVVSFPDDPSIVEALDQNRQESYPFALAPHFLSAATPLYDGHLLGYFEINSLSEDRRDVRWIRPIHEVYVRRPIEVIA